MHAGFCSKGVGGVHGVWHGCAGEAGGQEPCNIAVTGPCRINRVDGKGMRAIALIAKPGKTAVTAQRNDGGLCAPFQQIGSEFFDLVAPGFGQGGKGDGKAATATFFQSRHSPRYPAKPANGLRLSMIRNSASCSGKKTAKPAGATTRMLVQPARPIKATA